MRRVIETSMVRKLCATVKPEQLVPIETLIREEHQASHEGDIVGALDVTVDIHLKLAELSDNYYYYHFLEELISLTSVIIALYGTDQSFCHDHVDLLAAIQQQDGEQAARIMTEHLWQIERSLNFTETAPNVLNFKEIFQK